MRHDIHVRGHAFCLRPIELADASLILQLRSDVVRTQYLHRIPLDLASQESYLNAYFARAGDYYFVVDRLATTHDSAEGLVGIYDVDHERRRAQWGRWVIRPDSLAAVESAWLIYRTAFERLGLDEIYSQSFVENTSVLAFHDRSGLSRHRIAGHFDIDRGRCDVIEHVLTRAQWPETSALLGRQAERLAQRLRSSE